MWDDYARLAAQHYVTGRFAALAQFVPLCATMMHHAVELQLKCGLIKAGAIPTKDADQYLKKTYSHRLGRLWTNFKGCHPADDLSPFDELVNQLDRWENIRYPKQGIAMSVQVTGSTSATTATGAAMKGVSTYTLNVEQLDLLMQRTWAL